MASPREILDQEVDRHRSEVLAAEQRQVAIHGSRALVALRNAGGPLFALLDAARSPSILTTLQQDECAYCSLYQGPSAEIMAEYAPYLVDLGGNPGLLEKLVVEGWGDSRGIYLTSKVGLKELRDHFRHFTMVMLPGDRPAYFRFYDPRVLRGFLPTCAREQVLEFFGGVVDQFFVESRNGDSIVSFGLNRAGLVEVTTSLGEST